MWDAEDDFPQQNTPIYKPLVAQANRYKIPNLADNASEKDPSTVFERPIDTSDVFHISQPKYKAKKGRVNGRCITNIFIVLAILSTILAIGVGVGYGVLYAKEKLECRGGKVWQDCGSPCVATCEDKFPVCADVCVKGCRCPPHAPFWRSGVSPQCVAQEQCPDAINT